MDPEELKRDVYFSRAFAEANKKEEETVYECTYREKEKRFFVLALKKPVPVLSDKIPRTGWYDLETPYGFGGPVSNSGDPAFIRRAIGAHRENASEEGVVAEFIRFHPFNELPETAPEAFDHVFKERQTVTIPLEKDFDEIFSNFRSSLRRNIRKASRHEVGFSEITGKVDIEDLFLLYREMVDRKSLDESYKFSREYFRKILALDETRVFCCTVEGDIANYIVTFDSGSTVYYHLGATRKAYYSLNVNPYCFYRIIEYFHGTREHFFLGGGSSLSEDDPLFRFKAKFSDRILPFYIGGLIHNKEKYEIMCREWEAANPDRKDLKRILKYRFCFRNWSI